MQALIDYLGFLRLDWMDLAEILVVSYLLYRVLLVYTGTRAFQVLIGFVLLVSIYVASQALQLRLIPYLLSQVFTYGAFALIVIFQPELRAGLARLGRTRFFQAFSRLEQEEVMEQIAEAADRLAKAKIGGIIAIEQEVNLLNHVDHGTTLDADLSAELLTTVFTPYSPLHDGAVIVKRDRIANAGSVIPRLSESPTVDRSLGTRHRAALGLSEETDALVVVISEETGQISLAHQGRLHRGLRPDELRRRLEAGGREQSAEAGASAEPEVDRSAALPAEG
ncbi:MAG: diadenylate cyclase CdaA [marine benthic group bacterium]|jgi:diadenylate cyclase|nr:diadenylate cyclase CdaA [Gemmatimonadota bacterium]MCL7968919.1 diadenylate cyclase CdaA [Gemmatimonadota bacterium]MCL7974779.1 diadenylate cyclase CdaA [Gemmatimonadota bacterium]MCL7981168.1 diadenylate cyclase CdaA [Gemmatimonadota bacterium]